MASDEARFSEILNLPRFNKTKLNSPLYVGEVSCRPVEDEQHVLRCLIHTPQNGELIPEFLDWAKPMVDQAKEFQRTVVGIRHPYCYVTVRHGVVQSKNDDVWHVDGFSARYNHLPESNYVVVQGSHPTEWVEQRFDIPEDFDPMKHNLHTFLAKMVRGDCVRAVSLDTMYFIDPYVVHRRPPVSSVRRTFIRISFTPIEIPDLNNTKNPLFPTPHYINDGVAFRDTLVDYDGGYHGN